MQLRRSDIHKRRPNRLPLRLAGLCGILLVGFGIWKWASRPDLKSIPTPPPEKISPHTYTPGQPKLVDVRSGTYIVPLYANKHMINLALYRRATSTQKLLFNRAVSIDDLSVIQYQGEPIILLTMATEDTNSNGGIDAQDIHQLFWCNPISGDIHKINKPIFNFISYVSMLPEGSSSTGNGWRGEVLYKVSVDINHNGQADASDPIQFVLIDLGKQTLNEILPESVVPTSAIKNDDSDLK
jgi:hypothetical protein